MNDTLKLRRETSLPDEVSRVPGAQFAFTYAAPNLSHAEPLRLQDFLIDQYEVTNEKFKQFVQGGGYETQEYWGHPFFLNGRVVSWEEAMAEFTDTTGRPGPSTWLVGGPWLSWSERGRSPGMTGRCGRGRLRFHKSNN